MQRSNGYPVSVGRPEEYKEKRIPYDAGIDWKNIYCGIKEAEKSQIYIGISKHEYSTSYKKNTISAQSIEKGKKVSGGTEILLTISDGPEQMKVPDVVKKGLEEAKVLLEQQKLKHTVTFEYNDEYGEGIVLEQSVKAGKKSG
ncbi:PASTA domain-containing protein [Anaerobutyricum hallii]|nr:PASTA domain-containing protein [Anaerobutyricum hallii]